MFLIAFHPRKVYNQNLQENKFVQHPFGKADNVIR